MSELNFIEIDSNGIIQHVSASAKNPLAKALPAKGNSLLQIGSEETRNELQAEISKLFETTIPREFSIQGINHTLRFIAQSVGDRAYLFCEEVRPTTTQEDAPVRMDWGFEKLSLKNQIVLQTQNKESTLQKLTDSLPLVVFEIYFFSDGSFVFGFINKEMERFFPDFHRDQVNENNNLLFNRVHPDDKEALLESIKKVFAFNDWDITYRIVENDQTRWVKGFGRPEVGPSPNTITAYCYLQDITEQKLQEQQLKSVMASNNRILGRLQRQQYAIDQHINLIVVNMETIRIEYINEKLSLLLGIDQYDLFDKELDKFFNPATGADGWKDILDSLKLGKVHKEEISFRKGTDNRLLWLLSSFIPYQDTTSSDKFFIFCDDITENKRLQTKLESDKLRLRQGLLNSSYRAQEEIRALIGRELHDNINQILVGSKMNFARIKHKYPEIKAIEFEEGMSNLESAIQEIRKLSKNLVIYHIDDGDFAELLKDEILKFKKNTSIKTYYQIEVVSENITVDYKTHIIRILQEATTNIIKYAEATEVKIHFMAADDQMDLVIEDNGIGFNVKKNSVGIGLKNMQSRATAMNGRCNIVSQEGKGTFIHISVSLLDM